MNNNLAGIDPEILRKGMRQWASGVTVVTSLSGGERYGMTVSSFTSISVDPPMVTVTLNNATRTKQLVDTTGAFAINLLSEGQEELSERFAGRVSDHVNRFDGVRVQYSPEDIPMLPDAAVYVLCRVVYTYAMANSTLYIAEVIRSVKAANHPPLVYFDRSYHRIENGHQTE